MANQKREKLFKSHWEMRHLIDVALDAADSNEETSSTQFRVIFRGVVRGFIQSRLGSSSERLTDVTITKIIKYAARSAKKAVKQGRLVRFLILMTSNSSSSLKRGVRVEPLPTIAISLVGMASERINDIYSPAETDCGYRFYASDVNQQVGILVFEDESSCRAFQSKFFKENPAITDLIWNRF